MCFMNMVINTFHGDVKYSAKIMNFNFDDDSLDKIIDIFGHIEEKLGIDLNNFTCKSKGEEYLKTIEEYYYKCNLFKMV